MKLEKLIRAWQLSITLHEIHPPASEEEMLHAETILGVRIPPPLREFYLFSNGAYLLEGNLQILPLENKETKRDLISYTQQLREWHWHIPDEVLIYGDFGGDGLLGIWLPETHNPTYIHPVLEIGEIFEPKCMALLGTSVLPFLLGWTAHYLLLLEADVKALDAIELPTSLRVQPDELDENLFAELRKWADPKLLDYYPNPYRQRYDAEGLRALFIEHEN